MTKDRQNDPDEPQDDGTDHPENERGTIQDELEALLGEAPIPSRALTLAGADNQPVPQDPIPDSMFVFPLTRAVPFPEARMPISVESEKAKDLILKAQNHNGHLFLVLQKDPDLEHPRPEDLHEVGVVAKIVKVLNHPDSTMVCLAQGLQRARVTRYARKKPVLVARVKPLVEIPAKGREAQAMFRKLQEVVHDLVERHSNVSEQAKAIILNLQQPQELTDFVGSQLLPDVGLRQQILAAGDVTERLRLALEFTTKEQLLADLGERIQDEMRAKAEKAQKEYFLREQLKIIRRELGDEADPRETELKRLEQAIEESGMSEEARARSDEELRRLRTTPSESPEYGVIRNYLDWLTGLPWDKSTADRLDLRAAQKVLDEDHYGLEEIKERILEFLAVRKLKPGSAGSILCFSGPPGVGKTSLGRSIARAMNREFWRFSLGGMRDEAEIKGHRRTYIGAMPGRILQGMKASGTINPVILLDEVDKLGSDHRGDPSAALLEVLDPEQNHAFVDHYLDVPYDLSRVMFLATANVLPNIPEPLRDRMEVIELPGYLLDEKVEIARRHLLPRQLERHGLKKSHLGLSVTTTRSLVQDYTREAGVRSLEKTLGRLCRKAAYAVARGNKVPGRVAVKDLEKLLGKARYRGEGDRRIHGPGVVQGLAWTPVGGDVLYIEAVTTPGKGGLSLTGSLGDVMSESGRLAMAYLKSRAEDFGLDLEAIAKTDVHLHVPGGAIPKDGPSAGIAIATAFVSLLLEKAPPKNLAMTGELTVVGEVLPVGGIREKVLAARNLGLKQVILPAENQSDVAELKADLVKGVTFHYVHSFAEVFDIVFRPRAKRSGGRSKRR